MSNKHQELTSPEQTAPGKDFSNPLIVDSLLKTIWSSMHHVITMKHWLVQSKRLLFVLLMGGGVNTARQFPSFNIHVSYPTQYLTSLLMASLEFCDKHNMVAFLEKSTGSAGFHQIIDFITQSHIYYRFTRIKISSTFQKAFFTTSMEVSLNRLLLHSFKPKKTALDWSFSKMPDMAKTKQTYSSAYTKLILRVKKLEAQIKVGKARRHSRFVLSDTDVGEDDSSKQGRKLSNEEVQDDEGVQEKASTETELFIQEKKDTASEEVPPVSTAEVHISTAGGTVTYSRRNARGTKSQIAEMQKFAKYCDEEERKELINEVKLCKGIDLWNDPSLWDFNQKFVPMDAEKGSKKQKSPEEERSTEKIMEEEAVTQEERKEVVKEPAAKRKKSIPRKTTRKRQKLEVDTEKDQLKRFLDIVPREEAPIEKGIIINKVFLL
ncbi:hypothetical protein Tco_0860676 [Tanacetum coccineum]|uniref:Uncharacterized protein n=1 Tax=Tanacetum coccineum TaxID=301880 RepID=A0ABQ5BJN5_9ASTR